MYLGVHTPLDVGVSFVIAAVLVFAIYPLMRRADRYPRLMAGLLASMVLLSAAYLTFTLVYPFRRILTRRTSPAALKTAGSSSARRSASRSRGGSTGSMSASRQRPSGGCRRSSLSSGSRSSWRSRPGLKAPLIALFGGSAGLAGAVRYFLVVLAAGVLWPMAFRPLSRLGQRGEG